jgi:hypothetical protein
MTIQIGWTRRLRELRRFVQRRRWDRQKALSVHRRQEMEADAAYAQLVRAGRSALSSAVSRRIRDYSSEVLGSRRFVPWLRVYAVCQQRFIEGWVPDDYFELRVLPALHRYQPIHRKRTLSRRLFKNDCFPDLAYRVNGQWFTPDYELISREALESFVFARHDEVFFKLESSLEGKGVMRLTRSELGAIASAETAEDAVIQWAISQHPWCSGIYRGAVATIRITTSFVSGATPQFRAAYLRVGYDGRRLVQSARQLRCSVVDSNGTLAAEAFDERWSPHRFHPETGFVFEGSVVPLFADAVATCVALHATLPHDAVIGWDVALTADNRILLMEWNNRHPDIKFSEATVGPNFADCGFERFR